MSKGHNRRELDELLYCTVHKCSKIINIGQGFEVFMVLFSRLFVHTVKKPVFPAIAVNFKNNFL